MGLGESLRLRQAAGASRPLIGRTYRLDSAGSIASQEAVNQPCGRGRRFSAGTRRHCGHRRIVTPFTWCARAACADERAGSQGGDRRIQGRADDTVRCFRGMRMADIEYSTTGHIAHVRLNRPQGMNAITPEMDELLWTTWRSINDDPDVWCVIVSAEGEKAFCIGADVSGGAERKTRMALGGGITGIGGPLVTLKKPLIAAVQGFCVGGGFELAMCADIIIAADTARFGLPETKVGIIGECGVVHRAIRQLPHHIAMAMILTGERIKADVAARFGLVNEVVPYQELEAASS